MVGVDTADRGLRRHLPDHAAGEILQYLHHFSGRRICGGIESELRAKVVIGAEPLPGEEVVELTEMVIAKRHKWNGKAIRDLDISRQAFIVMVRRGDKKIVPKGSLVLETGDRVYMYKKVAES